MSRARIIGGVLAACCIAAPLGTYYEGILPVGYADPVGIPTDCIGETHGAQIGVQRYTADECVARYSARLQRNWIALSACITQDVTVPQAAALMSFSDNVGIRKTCGSTMVRLLNAGADSATWCRQMLRWTHATKLGVTIELPGLVKRRQSEYRACIARDVEHAKAELPGANA